MKILLTVHQFFPDYYSGTEVLARDTGLEMLSRGHEVHVLTVDPKNDRAKTLNLSYEEYDYAGMQVHAIGLPSQRRLLDRVRDEYDNELVARHVRQYVERLKPDVVHMFHISRLSGSVIEVFKELNVPLVFTPTDFWAICPMRTLMKPSGELSTGPDDISSNCLECREVERLLPKEQLPQASSRPEFYRKIAERALAKSENEPPGMELVRAMLSRTTFLREHFNMVDAIFAPTKFMHHALTANGIDQELVSLSPYGMDISRFRSGKGHRDRNGGLRLGYIGTISSHKGLHVLLEAFKNLPQPGRVTLRICGALDTFPSYARKVYDLADGDPRINFAGPFPNERIAEELSKVDVLVVPSTWYENTPLIIYTAFATGVPVVATNLGGMAEVVRHEENGLLFELGDLEDLTRQLKRLIDEPELLTNLKNNAGNVRTVEDSVDEMLALYERLFARRESPTGRAGA